MPNIDDRNAMMLELEYAIKDLAQRFHPGFCGRIKARTAGLAPNQFEVNFQYYGSDDATDAVSVLITVGPTDEELVEQEW